MSRQSELALMIISGDNVQWTEEMQKEVENLHKQAPKNDNQRVWDAVFEALIVMKSVTAQ